MIVKLTPAQERLIPYIVDGWYYSDIAKATGLSVRTVKKHVYDIAQHVPPQPHTPTFRRIQLWAATQGYGIGATSKTGVTVS